MPDGVFGSFQGTAAAFRAALGNEVFLILAACCFLVRSFTSFPKVELQSLGLLFLTVGLIVR